MNEKVLNLNIHNAFAPIDLIHTYRRESQGNGSSNINKVNFVTLDLNLQSRSRVQQTVQQFNKRFNPILKGVLNCVCFDLALQWYNINC